MRDEEQARPRQRGPQPRVVHRGHDRLAGAGRRHEQIAVVAARTGHLDEFEHAPSMRRVGGRGPATCAERVRLDDPMYAVLNAERRWNSHAFACRRVLDRS
jgi:hypothetical protein